MEKIFYLIAVILISSCGTNKKQEVEISSKQIISERTVDDKNTQTGYEINDDIKSRINKPLSLHADIVDFISKAKYIRTETWTDTICSNLTHIEEVELQKWGWHYMEEMKQKHSDINFEFGFDGMTIKI